jgi:hypothetical protein
LSLKILSSLVPPPLLVLKKPLRKYPPSREEDLSVIYEEEEDEPVNERQPVDDEYDGSDLDPIVYLMRRSMYLPIQLPEHSILNIPRYRNRGEVDVRGGSGKRGGTG